MARRKTFGKRKSHVNQHSAKKKCQKILQEEIQLPDDSADVSASKEKIEMDFSFAEDHSSGSSNIVVSMDILNFLFNSVGKCKNCDGCDCFHVIENKSSRRGLAVSISATCKNCGQGASTMTSAKVPAGYEVNLRLVYGMRCIGKGKAGAQTLCAVMNLPPPPAKFERYYPALHGALHTVSSSSMMESVEEAVLKNNGDRNISVSLDGSWQRRGHASKVGVVTAISLDNGKVLDFQSHSKYCFLCKNSNTECENCQANFEGVSGGMESDGALEIFKRSLSSRKVRYVEYLGDGDSRGFSKVEKANVYGSDVTVKKLECIGHVQKRMGTRLRNIKSSLKATKLSDKKSISGRGRLTDSEINLLQKYYGLAIQRNQKKTLMEMSQAVWAIYFHKLSTDQNPQHGLCPMGEDSWCGFNKCLAEGTPYTHQHSLPEAVLLSIKNVFRDLSSKELLLKCMHGRTQNPNESFNNCVWERVPKTTFVSKVALDLGIMDAVSVFNDGAYSRTKVLKELKINPGINTCVALRNIDKVRICEAEITFQKTTKEARTLKRQLKRQQEAIEMSNQDEYGAGMF